VRNDKNKSLAPRVTAAGLLPQEVEIVFTCPVARMLGTPMTPSRFPDTYAVRFARPSGSWVLTMNGVPAALDDDLAERIGFFAMDVARAVEQYMALL